MPCVPALLSVSLGTYLPHLGFSFWINICLFPALCYEALNNFPTKTQRVQLDVLVNSLQVLSDSFIVHPAPPGVPAEVPGNGEHPMLLCQSESPKSVLRLHSPPSGVGCTSQQEKPKNSWHTEGEKAREQGIVQKGADVRCRMFLAEKAQDFCR